MEKSDVLREVIANPGFCQRVRAVAAVKAAAILVQPAPTPAELAWAKLAVSPGYDGWTESLLCLVQASPATTEAAYNATDTVYAGILTTVLPQVIKAKGL